MFEMAFIAFVALLVVYILMLLIFRYQERRQKRQLGNLTIGDMVVTQGGLIGEVKEAEEDEMLLQVADGVRVRVLRKAIAPLEKAIAGRGASKVVNSAGTENINELELSED